MRLSIRRAAFLAALTLTFLSGLHQPAWAVDDWLPITPEELALKDVPEQPGAHAILLYRRVHGDDVKSKSEHYYRIKVLTEEGRKYADVEIPYVRQLRKVRRIKARTVQPDGTIVKFEGEIFDKLIVKARGVKVQAKTFSLPEVRVGSIIEYQFDVTWDTNLLNPPSWEVQHDLFTRAAEFSFKPYGQLTLSWTYRWLPPGVIPKEDRRVISLKMKNIPAFETEPYMPPESALRMQVDFYYFRRRIKSVEEFWQREGKDWYDITEEFIGDRKGVREAAQELVSSADPPEEQLLKLYARAQQIRNLSYERSRSEEEEKREKLKDNRNVEDVLERGYGYRSQINRLFAALARAAGFDAEIVRLSERDVQFFESSLLDWRQLDGEVTVVHVGGQDLWYDPGTPHCPAGLLAWQRTGVTGILLAKDGGKFITTPQPTSRGARVERIARLQVDPAGTLEGTVTVTFSGMEAIRRRLSALDTDEKGALEELEEEIKSWLPTAATVELQEVTGWTSFAEPLQVSAQIRIPDFAVSTGRRLLLPLAVFQVGETNPFPHAKRVHPVYFRSPFQEKDDLFLELPEGLVVENLPPKQEQESNFGSYEMSFEKEGSQVRIQRLLRVDDYVFQLPRYPTLQKFFTNVRTSDEVQGILQVQANSSQ